MSTEAIRTALEALTAIVGAYDAYRRRGVAPAPSEYSDVVLAINAARTAIATLTAEMERPAPEPVAWQPIETAPKDREVLVWFGPNVGVKSAMCTEVHGPEIWSWCVTDGKFDPHPVRRYCTPFPTHWMPLPAAPQEKDQT